MSKIREVDAIIDDGRLHEVHPEVSFRLLNDGKKIPFPVIGRLWSL